MRRVRLAVIGLGRLGRVHAENLAWRVAGVELVRVVDARAEVARELGARLGVDWADDAAAVLDDAAVEGVVIAAPTPTHVALVSAAAAAGKDVFCEKPLAFDLAAARDAVAAAAAAGVRLQVGFHRRFDPDWAAAVDRIRTGELGDIRLLRTTLRDMRPPPRDYLASAGSLFVDVTVHDFDTVRWMAGEITEVTATGAALDPEIAALGQIDTAVVVVRFANGALGVIDNSRAAGYGYECATEVVGSRATVRIDQHRRRHLQWLTPGRASVDWVRDFTERYPEAYRAELEDFAAAVRDDRPVRVSGADDLAAATLCAAAEVSLRERRPVPLSYDPAQGYRFGSQ